MNRNWRWTLNGALLALAAGLSACVIPRNPFPMSVTDGPRIPMALLPVGERDVGGFHGVPTNQLMRVVNRVLNSIASSKNNLIGPAEVLAEGDKLSALYVIRTRIVHMPSPTDVSIVHWSLQVEKKVQVRVEMQLLERNSPVVIAEADATEPYQHATLMLVAVPYAFYGETLGRATDRAARRAMIQLFNAAVTNSLSRVN